MSIVGCVSIHKKYAVNNYVPLLPEVSYQKVPLIYGVFCSGRIVVFSFPLYITDQKGLLSLHDLNGVDKGVSV